MTPIKNLHCVRRPLGEFQNPSWLSPRVLSSGGRLTVHGIVGVSGGPRGRQGSTRPSMLTRPHRSSPPYRLSIASPCRLPFVALIAYMAWKMRSKKRRSAVWLTGGESAMEEKGGGHVGRNLGLYIYIKRRWVRVMVYALGSGSGRVLGSQQSDAAL